MKTTPIEVRDQREQEWYWMNNNFVDEYGEILGTHAVAVYVVLCRHANNDTQKCFPSMETIGRKAGIKSRKTVSKAIEELEKLNIIEVEKAQGADGKRLNNIYYLKAPKAWKGAAKKKEDVPILDTHTAEVKPIGIFHNGQAFVYPFWLNAEVWLEWVAYRREKKQSLKPSTIKLQLAFLEKHKDVHVEIIRKSIMNGWTGLFELKGNVSGVKKLEAPTGKYAHMS